MFNRFRTFVMVLIVGAACLPLAAQTYSLQAFSYPYFPNVGTYALGINNRGAVVGHIFYTDRNGSKHRGFKREANGAFDKPIDDPNNNGVYFSLIATGINDSGEICGYYFNLSRQTYSGFLLDKGVFTDYFLTGESKTTINGINNQGDFVGNGSHAYANINGVVTRIHYPNGAATVPLGIGADDTIVGDFKMVQPGHDLGFLRGPAGHFKSLTVPGATNTVATGVNNAAHQIVGYYDVPSLTHGFVYDYVTGVITTVDWPDPNTRKTVITGVNSSGTIVGWAYTLDSKGFALPAVSFIGTPQ